MKTRKILEVNEIGAHYICVKHYEKVHPYRVYRLWYDGKQHKTLEKELDSMKDVLSYIYFAI